ncbi:MAG: hypothetical protein ACLGHN_00955 [Bacteriovoracia bacterium]
MKALIIFGLFFLVNAGPVKNEKLNPRVDSPEMPGTPTPIKKINQAPNPTPEKNKSDYFRGSTINMKKSQTEEKKVPQQRKKEK